jgi:hypothetical protein
MTWATKPVSDRNHAASESGDQKLATLVVTTKILVAQAVFVFWAKHSGHNEEIIQYSTSNVQMEFIVWHYCIRQNYK